MTLALVTGVNGQDGSYLAESLLRRGYGVVGVGRQPSSRYVTPMPRFRYVPLDLADLTAVELLFAETRPDVFFHLAAVHGAAGFFYEPHWRSLWSVNIGVLHAALEHARAAAPEMRIVFASSCKIFGPRLKGRIDETTHTVASCLYTISKIAALDLIRYYRLNHHLTAANLFLFNHDSSRRIPEYFMPTVARALAAARRDPKETCEVRLLDFYLDCSDAAELMDIAVDIAERAPDRDFVMASGRTWPARQLLDEAFARSGLDYRRHVVAKETATTPGDYFEAVIDRMDREVGRRPQVSAVDLLVRMATAVGEIPASAGELRS